MNGNRASTATRRSARCFHCGAARGSLQSARAQRRSHLRARHPDRTCATNRPHGRSLRPQGDATEVSSFRASKPARLNVRSIFVETHCRCGTRLNLASTTVDLGVPVASRVPISCTVQTADQLQRKPSPFLWGESQDLVEHVRRRHEAILADVRGQPRCRFLSSRSRTSPSRLRAPRCPASERAGERQRSRARTSPVRALPLR